MYWKELGMTCGLKALFQGTHCRFASFLLVLACSLWPMAGGLYAQTELGSEDDLTVLGVNGTADDPDVEVKGFSVFGATQAAYTGAVVGPGNVVVNGVLAVSSGAYVVGNSTFTGDVSAARYQINGSTVVAILPGTGSLGVGLNAGRYNTGVYNTFVGNEAGRINTTGGSNSFVGYQAGYYNVSGANNTFMGLNAGYTNTASGNSFVGALAGQDNSTGGSGSFMGVSAGQYNTTGTENSLFGSSAGLYNTVGSANSVFGTSAGGAGGAGGSFSGSTIMGAQAGYKLTTGNSNIFVGWKAGYNVTTGTGNIVIGYDKDTSAAGANSQLNIGGLLYGNLSARTIGISTRAPQAALDVVSTGTTVNDYAQIWRAADGTIVSSMTATGVLYGTVAAGDDLGDHTATQDLDLAQHSAVNVASITMTGDGLRIVTDLTSSSNGIFVSTSGAIRTIGLGNGTALPNARGIGAVDLQSYRVESASVASGAYAVIAGGANNAATALYAAVLGGAANAASGSRSVVAGGETNSALSSWGVVSGGKGNTVAGNYGAVFGGWLNYAGTFGTVAGGNLNYASGLYSIVAGGRWNTAQGANSFAAGSASSSTAAGTFTWSDSELIPNVNSVADRTVFKNRGGFLITGSTNPVMTGTLDRGMLVTGDGLVGIATAAPQAALDIVSTGTTVNDYAQIWRAADGTIVSSMTATGVLYGTVGAGDDLGDHAATQDLDLAQHSAVNVASVTMIGDGLRIGTDLASSASGLFISTSGAIMTIGPGNGTELPGARGFGAVDLQTYRVNSSSVASGLYSVIGGGWSNTASSVYTSVGGGSGNIASGKYATVGGGWNNTATGAATSSGMTVSGGFSNLAYGLYSVVAGGGNNIATCSLGNCTVSGGRFNTASGRYSTIPGGTYNTAAGIASFAAGFYSSSTVGGSFTWSDSQGIQNDNNVVDRTVFKNRGGFLITGSTNPVMTGTLDRGMLVTGDGLVGIATAAPQAALDVVSTGTVADQMAQIWRNSAGTVVSSVSATGVMMAAKFVGDGSGLSGVSGSDNLGNHTATQALNMSDKAVDNVSSMTVTGAGVTGADALFNVAGSTLVALNNGNVGIGTNSPSYPLEVKPAGLAGFQVAPQAGYVSLLVNGVEVARLEP